MITRFALAFSIGLSTSIAAQQPTPLVVGELRADGLIIPLAKWESDRWIATTFDSAARANFALPQRRWYLARDGGTLLRLRAGSIVRIYDDSGISYDYWGITTDLSLQPRPANAFPLGRIGFVANDTVSIDRGTTTALPASAIARVRTGVIALLDSVAAAYAATHDIAPPERRDTASLVVSKVYATISGHSAVAVRAAHQFGISRGANTCPLRAVLDGWIVVGPTSVSIQGQPSVDGCESFASRTLPFWTLPIGDRMFILGHSCGWDECYAIIWEFAEGRMAIVFPSTQ